MGFPGDDAGCTAHAGSSEAAAAAPEVFRKSRRLRFPMRLSRPLSGKIGGDRIDLRVGVAPGDLVHDGCRALARLEILHLPREIRAVTPGQGGDALPAHAVASMAVGDRKSTRLNSSHG